MKLQRIFAAALSGFLLMASVPALESDAAFVPDGAVASVTVNNVTSYYYDNPSSGGAEAMWNTAMTGTSATVMLYADWNSSYGTRFGTGAGFIYDGALNVPSGHEITIDLNGYSINRNLEFAVEHGEVIHVAGGGTLNLTDTNQAVESGSITGGNSQNGAGGIYIEAGGTVNMWGGNLTGNKSELSGGAVLLAGEGSLFSMSGGKIFNNSAQQCGGGVAVSDGTFKLANGDITNNTGQDGGGIYAQAGEVSLSGGTVAQNTAVHGGGVLLNGTAAFTLKGKTAVQSNIASGENRVGGGILAMGSMPIKIGGKPTVLNNSADGVQSNLVFWQENAESNTVLPCHIQNVGTDIEAKIGVSLAGNLKSAIFAPDWSGSDCFICDAMDYALENQDGNLVLKRSLSYSSVVGNKKMLLLIVTCVLIALAVIAILILAFKKNTKEEEKPKTKKKVTAVKVSKKPKKEEPAEEEELDDDDEDEDEEDVEDIEDDEEYEDDEYEDDLDDEDEEEE
ncbi:MAG: hypothetical protein IJ642_08985 [Oscillospiraceae bacterium]|nr:hypothetical protein [Oscillospiraceae bacterium]